MQSNNIFYPQDNVCNRFLTIIMAFNNSRDIPKKMLRKLHGKPLIGYCISMIEDIPGQKVVVTDDDEVALFAERQGLISFNESKDRFVNEVEICKYVINKIEGRHTSNEFLLLLSSSVPLFRMSDLSKAFDVINNRKADTVVSVKRVKENIWNMQGGVFVSDFSFDELNKKEEYEITEGFILTHIENILKGSLLGESIDTIDLPRDRAVAIHSFHEWWICEKLLKRKKVLFVVAGNQQIGMGHVYRALTIANELTDHEISFLSTHDSDLAVNYITKHFYPSEIQGNKNLEDEVIARNPDLVVNDILDTKISYVQALRSKGIKVVNFEDQGSGAELSNLVINALFKDKANSANVRWGPDYFCLRHEFLNIKPGEFRKKSENILVTFGGVDRDNQTGRILDIIGVEAVKRDINIFVVTGPGYLHGENLRKLVGAFNSDRIQLKSATKRISDYMSQADIAICSAGRTVYELIHMKVPSIVISTNSREETHYFPPGGLLLRLDTNTEDKKILNAAIELMDNSDKRKKMHEAMSKLNYSNGINNVVEEIIKLLKE